jgi:uncharacterized protein
MSDTTDDDSPFHTGERAVQSWLGVDEEADQIGRKMFRSALPDAHRALFAQLPYLLAGSLDPDGQPWASMLVGRPGFIDSPDAQTLRVHARPFEGDPLAHALVPGSALGLLGIQLQTRRRMRLNGHVAAVSDDDFTVHVDQSFGNCPKYITARAPIWNDAASALTTQPEVALLSLAAKACIAASDTCFIASASAAHTLAADTREGVDVSHRGGKPGFARVTDTQTASVLTLPDFAGNNMFNTLGNLARYPQAGLLFPNFETGDLLSLTCDAEIIWHGAEVAAFRGAERLLRLHVRRGLFMPQRLPFRWSAAQPAAQLDKTGSWG